MRLKALDPDALEPAQKAVMEAIFTGPRRAQMEKIGLQGPFPAFVRSPALGGPAQALGAAVRYGSALPDNVREVAICTVGVFHRARFEVAAHRDMAIAAGVDSACLDRLETGADPGFAGAENIAWQVARQLLSDHRLEPTLYRAAESEFGEAALVDLVLTIGYYCLISHTLNAFEVPLADGMRDPWPE